MGNTVFGGGAERDIFREVAGGVGSGRAGCCGAEKSHGEGIFGNFDARTVELLGYLNRAKANKSVSAGIRTGLSRKRENWRCLVRLIRAAFLNL